MAEINAKRFEYELRDFRDGNYLADMLTLIPPDSPKQPYKVEDEIELTDSLVHKNNSKRFTICSIKKLEFLSGSKTIRAYLMPIKKEYIPAGRYDGEKLLGKRVDGIDWSGSDDWLHPA